MPMWLRLAGRVTPCAPSSGWHQRRARRSCGRRTRPASKLFWLYALNQASNNFPKYALTRFIKGVGFVPFAARLPPQECIAERAMKKQQTNKSESPCRDEAPAKPAKKPVTVLHVDDDPNDTTLFRVACAKADVNFELQNIEDPNEAMEYLSGLGKYADRTEYQMPGLVLLDLKMPRATGLEILKWIRNHSVLKHLPVIVLSGSELKEDIHEAYAVGANSYFVKPPSFDSLVNLVKNIGAQLPTVSRPPGGASRSCL
jgi:CheY-like chemotaxis protein